MSGEPYPDNVLVYVLNEILDKSNVDKIFPMILNKYTFYVLLHKLPENKNS